MGGMAFVAAALGVAACGGPRSSGLAGSSSLVGPRVTGGLAAAEWSAHVRTALAADDEQRQHSPKAQTLVGAKEPTLSGMVDGQRRSSAGLDCRHQRIRERLLHGRLE